MTQFSLLTLAVRLAGVIVLGTVFFRWAEGWSWVDCYFFTVVTISTVGYGDPIPVTDMGKIGATVLIFAGLGVFALTIQQIAAETLAERDRHPGVVQRMLMRMNRARHGAREQGHNDRTHRDHSYRERAYRDHRHDVPHHDPRKDGDD